MKKFLITTLVVFMISCLSPICMAEQEIAVVDNIEEIIAGYRGGSDCTLNLLYDDDTQTLTASNDDYILKFLERYWGVPSVTDPRTFQSLTLERSVRHLVVEEGVVHISNSFNDMELLETVTLPESVTDIRTSFNGCPNLKSVSFAKENELLGENSFVDCPSLQTILVAEETHSREWMEDHLSVKPTVHYEFDEKSATLTVSGTGEASYYLPRGEGGGFEDEGYFLKIKEDRKIEHLIIKEGITEIYNCFNDMMELKTVRLPRSLKSIHDSFQRCEKLKEISFPRSMENISGYSFNDCLALKKITFNGAIKIGSHYQQRTFCNLPKLKTLYLPNHSSISGYSFCSCESLYSVRYGGPDVEVADFVYEEHGAAFQNCPRLSGLNGTILSHPLLWVIAAALIALFAMAGFLGIRRAKRKRTAQKTERNPEW